MSQSGRHSADLHTSGDKGRRIAFQETRTILLVWGAIKSCLVCSIAVTCSPRHGCSVFWYTSKWLLTLTHGFSMYLPLCDFGLIFIFPKMLIHYQDNISEHLL